MSRRYGPLAVAVVLTAGLLHLGWGTGWNDPLVTPGSLAQEARHKLSRHGCSHNTATADVAYRSVRGKYLVIDSHTNTLYLRTTDRVLFRARCSTGTGAELTDRATGRSWRFDTPRGFFRVTTLTEDPWWRKPDWAFIEEGVRPPRDDELRLDGEALGEYAIGFGDGYFIHGTLYERLIGVSVTHGCIRLGSADLKRVYSAVGIGTPIIVF